MKFLVGLILFFIVVFSLFFHFKDDMENVAKQRVNVEYQKFNQKITPTVEFIEDYKAKYGNVEDVKKIINNSLPSLE